MVSSFVGSGCSVGFRPFYTRRPGRLHPDPSTPRIMAETSRKANPFPPARAPVLHNPPPRRPRRFPNDCKKVGSSGTLMDCDECGRIQGMGCAQAFAPLREGGGARWKDCQWDWAFGANGKGGGGSTAGSRRCMRPVCRAAEVLIRPLPVLSRACRDGQAQYSPRRGPCRFPPSRHGHPIHGRATPLSEGGGFWHPPCSLHSRNSGDDSTKVPKNQKFPMVGKPKRKRWLPHGVSLGIAD